MADRDVIVVGASAGGVEALRALVANLPSDLPACLLIVLHMPRSSPSALPAILQRATGLAVRAAVDGEPLRRGRIYVAPVDRHLVVLDRAVRLSRDEVERGHRPAIDPLFRSAAAAFGTRVVGVVLSGSGDDGAAGLAAISRRGGVTVIQDPAEAEYPAMPLAALREVAADHVAPVAEMGALLDRIVRDPAPDASGDGDPLASVSTAGDPAAVDAVAAGRAVVGPGIEVDGPSGYRCPACEQPMYEIDGSRLLRFRCRSGHAWSAETLLDEQTAGLESAFWTALRILRERGALSRRMAVGPGRRRDAYRDAMLVSDQVAAEVRKLIEAIATGADVDGARSPW